MANFDEKAGLVKSATPWGLWSQTMDEVIIEVQVEEGTRGRDVACDIKPNQIALNVKGKNIIKVTANRVSADLETGTIKFRENSFALSLQMTASGL
eukprot:m.68859 g.68859  ORF g.68859 m.68859 type:complete len:96 (+) comp35562_c0_seq2:403-690(+)